MPEQEPDRVRCLTIRNPSYDVVCLPSTGNNEALNKDLPARDSESRPDRQFVEIRGTDCGRRRDMFLSRCSFDRSTSEVPERQGCICGVCSSPYSLTKDDMDVLLLDQIHRVRSHLAWMRGALVTRPCISGALRKGLKIVRQFLELWAAPGSPARFIIHNMQSPSSYNHRAHPPETANARGEQQRTCRSHSAWITCEFASSLRIITIPTKAPSVMTATARNRNCSCICVA